MNDLESKSFYSFLGLYIFSSLLFISLVGYWYYAAQKNALENETYYKLQHSADMRAGDIIMAHMHGVKLKNTEVPKEIELALINTDNQVQEGRLIEPSMPKRAGYYHFGDYDVFVSDAPREHLNISFVVAQSNTLAIALKSLEVNVWKATILVAILIAFIAWVLSKLFMRPVRQRVKQIESFINDVTHELNTPITALFMASNQALKQENCTQKTLKNISISTKQLHDIYSALTYINFSDTKEIGSDLDIEQVLEKSIGYYEPLCESKRIKMLVSLEKHIFSIPQARLQLLFGNLIGNAIKYSPAGSSISINLQDGIFSIKDEGIGIEESTQKEIFKKFKRGTAYSGGFGVGLSIVKSICDEYDIGLELNSVLDKGTEFRLRF